jgi:hypothetical protein
LRKYIYADEAGNFDFSRDRGASHYFILTAVLIDDHGIESEFLNLRRELVWEGTNLPEAFHATTDAQSIRDRVFELLSKYDFRVDATVVEKTKAIPRIRQTEETFYKYAWFYHMKYVAPRVASKPDELMVIAASIGTKRKLRDFRYAVEDVMAQTSPTRVMRVDMWPAAVDPCLQVADYCCWAIQRKWEGNDSRSYDLIKSKVRSEYNLFGGGTTSYY